MNDKDIKAIIDILQQSQASRDRCCTIVDVSAMPPQNFEEDDIYTGQFSKIHEGHSGDGSHHYLTYARFTVTQGNDVVRYITNLDTEGITNPIGSLAQHVNLWPHEIEDLFLAYLKWSLIEQGVAKDDNEAKQT